VTEQATDERPQLVSREEYDEWVRVNHAAREANHLPPRTYPTYDEIRADVWEHGSL
jgi:hypothetical protein